MATTSYRVAKAGGAGWTIACDGRAADRLI